MNSKKRVWNKKGYGELVGVGIIILLALVFTVSKPLITGLVAGNTSLDNISLNLSVENMSVVEENASVGVIVVEENVSLFEEVMTNITENETVENISLENLGLENVTGNVDVNVSEINLSLDNLSIENVSINTSVNITENISINETLEVVEKLIVENISLGNITAENVSVNLSANVTENITINVTTEEKIVGRVMINRPVKFIKKIKLTASKENLIVELPKNASNIEVKKITGRVEKDISNKVVVKKGEIVEELSEHNLAILTGGVVGGVGDGLLFKLIDWLKGLFRFTGYVVEEITEDSMNLSSVLSSTEIIVEESVEEIEVEYELPGPTAVEEELGGGRKRIVVSSEIHYEDILAYTFIPDSAVESVKLYWIVDGERESVNFDGYDTTGTGLVDYVEWIVPSLSNQTYEIEINVLNPIEYLRDGDTWTMMFNTTGTANLSIRSTNAYWEEVMVDNGESVDEMRFVDFKCGEDSLLDVLKIINNDGYVYDYSSISDDDSIKPVEFLVEDYSCSEIGRFVNYMNIGGYATLILEFSNQDMSVTDYAYDPSYTYDSCDNITVSGTHEMNASIDYYNDTELCFNINASDVVFDCGGYHIDGEYNANYVNTFTAINIDNVTNVTVKNCDITDFTYGIYYDGGSDNGYIFNNSIHLVDSNYTIAGIVSDTSDNVLIDSNTIRNIGDGGVGSMGISVSECTGNNVTNNILHDISGSGIYVRGSGHLVDSNEINDTQSGNSFAAIQLDNCDDSLINANELIGTNGCSAKCNNYGIELDTSSNNNITGNTINNPTDNFVYLHSSSIGNRIVDQVFNITQFGAGVKLTSACENNTLDNLTIHNSYLDGIEFSDSSNNNNITDVEMKYNNYSGISFDDSHNNSVYAVLITDSQDSAVYFLNSSGNEFMDSTLDGNSLHWGDDADVWVEGTASGTNTFVNISFNESATLFSDSGSSAIYVNWYLDVYVNDSSGAINGANVSAWDTDDLFVFSVLSGGDGWIARQNISEYYENCSSCNWVAGTKNYLTNYTLNNTKSGYGGDSRGVNLTDNGVVYVTLSVLIPSNKKFAITTSYDDIVGSIDDTGNMFIRGTLSEESSISLSPEANSFILQDNTGRDIAYVSNTGNLFLVGELTENAVMRVPVTALKFVNASDSLVAFFDNSGNLKLKGSLAQSYSDP